MSVRYIVYVNLGYAWDVEYCYEGPEALQHALSDATAYHNVSNWGEQSGDWDTDLIQSFISFYGEDGSVPEIGCVSVWDCAGDTDVWIDGSFEDVQSLETIEDIREQNLDLDFYRSLVEEM